MAIKTFTTGEVLTASDTNTYLANSGLVYITSGTFAQADCKVQSCFSATYDNYLLVLSNFTTSAFRQSAFQFLVGATATGNGYNYGGWYVGFGGASSVQNATAQAYMALIGTSTSGEGGGVWNIQRPFLVDQTTIQGQGTSLDGAIMQSGNNTNATSFDGWRITNLTSDTNNFSYAVFGYRKA
jgi:hypothetical protein